MLIVGNRRQVDGTKAKILLKWKGKDLGPVELFLGFQISRDRKNRTLTVHQEMYTTKIVTRFGMDRCNPSNLPMDAKTILKSDEDNLLDKDEQFLYLRIVGSVIYLANSTRLDICYSVG